MTREDKDKKQQHLLKKAEEAADRASIEQAQVYMQLAEYYKTYSTL